MPIHLFRSNSPLFKRYLEELLHAMKFHLHDAVKAKPIVLEKMIDLILSGRYPRHSNRHDLIPLKDLPLAYRRRRDVDHSKNCIR